MYVQGKELTIGYRAQCLSSVAGIVTNSPEYLVLNTKDKKGNAQLADLATGDVVTASPMSVWDQWSMTPQPNPPLCGLR